jgi:exodeoxyribonuclease-3
LKIATWNVNGIRAREAQFVEWIRRDQPDIACLQELKATPDQLSETLTMLPEYWSYWHGGPKGYSGVSLHLRKDRYPERPEFSHPTFDMECRVVQAKLGDGLVIASVYVPNGGKDFAAKLRFLEAMSAYAAGVRAAGGKLVIAGDLNVTRTEKDVTAKERTPEVIGQRPDERALFEQLMASGLGRSTPRTRRCSPGGRPGEECARRTAAGASTTCSRATRSRRAGARFWPTSGRAITRRWWRRSRSAHPVRCRDTLSRSSVLAHLSATQRPARLLGACGIKHLRVALLMH